MVLKLQSFSLDHDGHKEKGGAGECDPGDGSAHGVAGLSEAPGTVHQANCAISHKVRKHLGQTKQSLGNGLVQVIVVVLRMAIYRYVQKVAKDRLRDLALFLCG